MVYGAVVELMLCGSSPQAVVHWLVRLCHEQRGSPSFRHYVNIFGCLASLLSKEYRQYAAHKFSRILLDPVVRSPSFVALFFSDLLADDLSDLCGPDGTASQPTTTTTTTTDLRVNLALWHATWTQANMTQVTNCVSYVREFIRPHVDCEGRFLLACHMCGPLMWPLQTDKSGKLIELVAELYQCLAQVPPGSGLVHGDTVADLMYHVKYIYVGNGVLEYVRELMPHLEDRLRSKLKFIMPQPPA